MWAGFALWEPCLCVGWCYCASLLIVKWTKPAKRSPQSSCRSRGRASGLWAQRRSATHRKHNTEFQSLLSLNNTVQWSFIILFEEAWQPLREVKSWKCSALANVRRSLHCSWFFFLVTRLAKQIFGNTNEITNGGSKKRVGWCVFSYR